YDQVNNVFIPFTSLKGISSPFMLQSVQQSPVDSPINFKIGSTHTSGFIDQIILMESWICIGRVNITIRIYPSLIKIGGNGGTIGSISTREFRKLIKIPHHVGFSDEVVLMEAGICIGRVNVTIRIHPSVIEIGGNGGTIGSISTREFRKRIKIPRHGEIGHTVMSAQVFPLVDGKDQFLI